MALFHCREKEQLERASQEVDRLQTTNNELEGELLACRNKEAELLAFTQKLSDKNVQIQSQLSALQSKVNKPLKLNMTPTEGKSL